MDNWYGTVGGRQFADKTVPKLIRAIESLTDTIESANKINEEMLRKLSSIEDRLDNIESSTAALQQRFKHYT